MSSSLARAYVNRQRSFVHPLLAITMPFFFTLCLDAAVRVVIPSFGFPQAVFLAVLLLVSVEVTVVGNILFDERASFLARLRELIVIMAAMYVALSLTASIRARAYVPADVTFIYPLVLVFFQWNFVVTVHMQLRDREILLAVLASKEGEAMLHSLRDASLQASAALRSLRRASSLAAFFQAAVFFVLAICLLLRVTIPPWALIACALHAAYGLLVRGILNTFAHDQVLLGEGVVVPGRLEAARLWAALALVAIGLPLAVLGSRNASPLPLSIILAFFSWLAGLLPSHYAPDMVDRIQKMIESRLAFERQMLASAPPPPINPSVFLLLEALRRLFVTVVGAAVYFFLVSPLLSEEFFDSLKKRSLIAFLSKKLSALLHFFTRAARRLMRWLRRAGRPMAAIDEPAGKSTGYRGPPAAAAKASLRKRLQVSRILRAFLLLLRWGGGRGVAYQSSETPLEYSHRLREVVPLRQRELSLIVEVLEEALFSSHLLARKRVAGYFLAIREVRASV